MEKEWDYKKIMSDRELFDKTVYTPLSEAVRILEERQKDKKLIEKIEKLLNGNIPEPLKNIEKCGVQFRQIATPNVDGQHFIAITEGFGLRTIFFEYLDDKFTSNNCFKHSLGQLRIHDGINRYGQFNNEKITIVDFAKYDGEKLKDVVTLKSKPLADLHKDLFNVLDFDKNKFVFFDLSGWLKENGEHAENYYKNLFLLFIVHGILFENFLMSGTEGEFSEDIALPAIKYVEEIIGLKPLIVPIPPMEIEEEEHWVSYHPIIKKYIKNKI